MTDRVIAVLNDLLVRKGVERDAFPPDLRLDESGYGLDSLDMATFSVALEQVFGTDPYSAGRFPRTLADVLAFYEV